MPLTRWLPPLRPRLAARLQIFGAWACTSRSWCRIGVTVRCEGAFRGEKKAWIIVSMGAGAIVSATRKWIPWVNGLFRNVQPDDTFGIELLGESARRARGYSCRLNGPQLCHVTSSKDWRPVRDIAAGYTIEIGGVELLESVDQSYFPNARIASGAAHQGRDVPVAAVAMQREEVVGVATFSTDSDSLWQMGIDVLCEHRSRGSGVTLTSQATRVVLDQGKVPYYSNSVANITSRLTAQPAGFYPCWTSSIRRRSSVPPQGT